MLTFFSACNEKDVKQILLNKSSHDYFNVKNGSKYFYSSLEDTSSTKVYTVGSYINGFANPDISNNEYLFYEIKASETSKFVMRVESGTSEFSDRISLLTYKSDTITIGPVFFNTAGEFNSPSDSKDSISILPNITFSNTTFNDLILIKPFNTSVYREVYFAKGYGLVAYRAQNGVLYFSKRTVIKN